MNHGLVKAVVYDETGKINAFFKGETTKFIKKDSVIAIRNGKIRVIKNHPSLEIDIFGRVTPETVEIKEGCLTNISEIMIIDKKWKNYYKTNTRMI